MPAAYPVAMTSTTSCVFCDIATGAAPAHIIWESESHLAFLSIFPNTAGFSVVMPRAHLSSYVAELPEADYLELHTAAREVAHLLDSAFADVGRTAIMYEGYGIDHAHAKLTPLHGTAGNTHGHNWHAVESDIDTYFERYPGYISSHDAARADDTELAGLARRIRSHNITLVS